MVKSKRMKWAGQVTRMRKTEMHRDFGRKLERKRPLGRPRCRREDDIRMGLRER
jgi:hypothetical protein